MIVAKTKDVMLLGELFDYKDVAKVGTYVDYILMFYPILLGHDDVIKQIGSTEVMPASNIYNPRGVLLKTKRALVTKSYLEALIATESLKLQK